MADLGSLNACIPEDYTNMTFGTKIHTVLAGSYVKISSLSYLSKRYNFYCEEILPFYLFSIVLKILTNKILYILHFFCILTD